MKYSEEDYQRDLLDPNMPHLDDRERFKQFYEHLANGPAKDVQYPGYRMNGIAPSRGGKLLELGCHVGYNLIHWTQNDPDLVVVGVDVSATMLDYAQKRIDLLPQQQQDRIYLHEAFIEDFHTYDEWTDIVLTETLEHVQHPQPVVNVAVKHMVEGTKLWVTVPSVRWGNYSHVRGVSCEELQNMLVQAGLKLEEIDYCHQRRVAGEPMTIAKATKR